ncbi:MAG: type II secretion system F family protein [Sedimentisphaerales bacterium]|nr:type II secretion system F family protein [Sedimentisphaerales bacterium]
MPVFTYVAKDEKGAMVTGTYADVGSSSELRDELDKIGYTLVRARKGKQSNKENRRFGRVKQADVATFAYKFAGMYTAGLPILRCLETLEQQADNPFFRDIITDVREGVASGSSLRDAFGKYRDIFSDFFLGMIEAGEVGGKLGDTLQMSAVYLEKQVQLKQKLISSFIYPVFVSVMCLLVITFLLIFVIPVFSKLYAQVHANMPGPTLVLVAASNFVRTCWPAAIIIAGLSMLGIRKLFKTAKFRAGWDDFKLNMPIFGKLNRMLVILHFTRTFAMLLSVGVSVIKSLEMACVVAHNETFSGIISEMKKSIQSGGSIAGSFKKYDIFVPVIVQMASSGEEVGMLPEMLGKGAELLDKDVERAINSLLVKLEPALTLAMGLIVGFILMGAYLPMFDYMGHLK